MLNGAKWPRAGFGSLIPKLIQFDTYINKKFSSIILTNGNGTIGVNECILLFELCLIFYYHKVGSSGGAPSKWWPYDIVAKIIGGEASLDNDLLSQSQNFSTLDFQDGQIATMEDGKETVSILNIEAFDDTSDVQSIVNIPDKEPT
nr:uncharacterized protein LOC124809434 [Hydra vulgaris]